MIHVPVSYLPRTTHQIAVRKKANKHVIKKMWQNVTWQWLSAFRRPEEERGVIRRLREVRRIQEKATAK
jgi:hypothetical protein